MKCDCGYTAFYYQKFADNRKWDVYKCGHVMIESKKKTKCDMNVCEYVSEINHPEIKKQKVYTTAEQIDPEKLIRNDLQNYIYLCDITKQFSKKYRWNYIANINYLLKKLNFDLYFEETETLESLKSRVKNKYAPRVPNKTKFPVKLVDSSYLSEYLAATEIKQETPRSAKEKNVSKSERVNKTKFFLTEEEPIEVEKKPKEEILDSDSDSDENEDNEDNTFDVDNYDSGEDYEDFDDGGTFSD
tara:strand:- start:9486 stop:10217 length:732 start_codon:yes stop_codon:yes gene_type:complete